MASIGGTTAPASSIVTTGFGDGHDGAAVFNGTDAVTGFTRSGSTYTATTAQEFHFTDITVPSGSTVVVNPAGCPVYVSGAVNVAGSLTLGCPGGSASADTAGAASSTLGSTRFYPGFAGAAGRTTSGTGAAGASAVANTNSMGAAGGAGGTASNAGGAASTPTYWDATKGSLSTIHSVWRMQATPISLAACAGGAGGGAGGLLITTGTGASGGGGGGGGMLWLRARRIINTGTLTISAAGGAGGTATATGTTVRAGGGGGGGGGHVSVLCDSITGSATVTAAGGNGGNGAQVGSVAANGGGGGSGGLIWLAYRTKSGTITTSVLAGTGGTGSGGGTAGSDGSAGTAIVCDL